MLKNDINIDDVKNFLILLGFEHYQDELKDDHYKDECYYFRIYNSRFYEVFFNRNGFHMNIADVNDKGDFIHDDASESVYGRENTIKYLNIKFKGVIRQNKINKLLNDK
jgi:hypothetical protein